MASTTTIDKFHIILWLKWPELQKGLNMFEDGAEKLKTIWKAIQSRIFMMKVSQPYQTVKWVIGKFKDFGWTTVER